MSVMTKFEYCQLSKPCGALYSFSGRMSRKKRRRRNLPHYLTKARNVHSQHTKQIWRKNPRNLYRVWFFYLPLEAFVKTVQSNFSKYVCSILMSFLLAECASNNSNIAIALQQFNHLRSLLVTFICIAACFDLPRETLLVCFNLLVLCIELSGVLFEIDANFDASWKCPSIVGFVHRPKAALVQN